LIGSVMPMLVGRVSSFASAALAAAPPHCPPSDDADAVVDAPVDPVDPPLESLLEPQAAIANATLTASAVAAPLLRLALIPSSVGWRRRVQRATSSTQWSDRKDLPNNVDVPL
jgi:hypothetical protein